MKRFFSIVLTLALVLTSLVIPVAAEDAVVEETVAVDITTLTDGQQIPAGSSVTVMVDASSLTNVKHIDIYANGSKLPGTIAGNTGAIIWYNAAEGAYEITTKVTYTDNTVKDGNETLNVVVMPDESRVKVLWPDGGTYTSSHGNGARTLTTDYAMFGKNSLKMIPKNSYPGVTFSRADQNIERTWGKMVFVVYSPEEVADLKVRRTGGTPNSTYGTGQQMVNNTFFRSVSNSNDLTVYPGYNVYVAESATYTGNADTLYRDTDGDGVVDAPNENNYLDYFRLTFTGAGATELPVYLLGVYGVVGDMLTPVATPEIPDASTGIDTAVGKYRINFSSAIYPDALKVPATVTDSTGTAVADVTYAYGTDYVELTLPELTAGETYTVSIPEQTILSYYVDQFAKADRQYVAASSFTFTTAADATPIVAMSYPADGATVPANSSFAAKLVAGSDAIASVKLYNGETEVATGVEMADGEYWFEPATAALTADAATTLTVKALDANGAELATDAATYTGAAAPGYAVKGIYEDATYVAQEETTRKITVVDAANANIVSDVATDVEKVEFYHNDELVATDSEAPYEYDLGFKKYFGNTLAVKVYDVYGGVHDEFSYNYYVANGVKNTTESVDTVTFESLDEGTDLTSLISTSNSGLTFETTTYASETDENNTVLKVSAVTSDANGGLRFKGAPSTMGAKVHYYEFDFVASPSYAKSIYWNSTAYNKKDGQIILNNQDIEGDGVTAKSGPDKKVTLGVILDYNNGATATVYIDGKEFKRISLDETVADPMLNLYIQKNQNLYAYIDNFKYSVYDVAPEKAGLLAADAEGNAYSTVGYTSVSGTGHKTFKSAFKNETTSDITVRYLIPAYDATGRMVFLYDNHRMKDNETFSADRDLNVTYKAGEIDKEVTFYFNMGAGEVTDMRMLAFYALNGDNALVPVGYFAE